MPPIEVGPLRALGAIGSGLARKSGDSSGPTARTEKASPAIVQSEVLDPGEAPVDVERIKLIRKAVEEGTYPVLPARIADAMIAAGYLLRSGKE